MTSASAPEGIDLFADFNITPTAASPRSSQALQYSGHVLYIEDNAVNVLVVQELVSQRPQLQLTIALDGASGLRLALALKPDLILLDMQLPDLDGYQVLAGLRGNPETSGITCIAVSANAMLSDMRRAREAGFAAYWTKPIDFKAFLAGLDAHFAPA
jgi:CheY-like chemotaxis protein